ncbi:hypothetical protein L1889_17655 [Paenalcaligenes niemegkensis]|uniref:hypothetical protein n=1 Tax=Paenalcaligenes niemegkensis TaxID=2895469 RepID=UPI001EE82AB1|nr:hypothetical protein [Paenalcaligenes niemegkensis]MCQ9618281.1 hypothetical protein [Paenalcaligenes niemegkensis]
MNSLTVPFTQQQLILIADKLKCDPSSDEFKEKLIAMFRLYAEQRLGREYK